MWSNPDYTGIHCPLYHLEQKCKKIGLLRQFVIYEKKSDHLLTSLTERKKKIVKRAKSCQSQSGAHSCCTFWPPLSQTCFARGRVIATLCTPCDYFLTPLFPSSVCLVILYIMFKLCNVMLCTACDYFLTPLFPLIKYNSVTQKKVNGHRVIIFSLPSFPHMCARL